MGYGDQAPAPSSPSTPSPGPAMTDADGSTMVLQLEKTASSSSSFKPTATPFVPSSSLSLKRPGSASSMAVHAAPFVPGGSVNPAHCTQCVASIKVCTGSIAAVFAQQRGVVTADGRSPLYSL